MKQHHSSKNINPPLTMGTTIAAFPYLARVLFYYFLFFYDYCLIKITI